MSFNLRGFCFCIAIVLFGCNNQSKHTMDLAEELVKQYPDSALTIINRLSIDNLSGKSSVARYALLKTMILDKNYIDVTSDSLIYLATDYYYNKDTRHYMLSLYYNGLIQKNGKNYTAAVVTLEKASSLAEMIPDWHYAGLAYRNIGDCFNATNNHNAAIEYHKNAVKSFEQSGETRYLLYAKYSLAVDYANNGDYTKSRILLDSLKSRIQDDVTLLHRCSLCYARTLVEERELSNMAISLYKSVPTSLFSIPDYGFCSLAFSDSGDLVSARKWIEIGLASAKSSEEIAYLEFFLADHFSNNRQYDLAYSYVSKAAKVQDSLARVLLQESLGMAQRDYYKQEALTQGAIADKHKQLFVSILCILMLSISIMSLIAKEHIHRKETALNERILQLEIGKRKADKDKVELIKTLFLEKISGLEDVTNISLANIKERLQQSGQREETFSLLDRLLNTHLDGIMTRFTTQMPRMSGEHRKTVSLFFAGIPDEIIQVMMRKMSVGSLKTARSRYRNEIKTSSAPDKELFLALLEKQPRKKNK